MQKKSVEKGSNYNRIKNLLSSCNRARFWTSPTSFNLCDEELSEEANDNLSSSRASDESLEILDIFLVKVLFFHESSTGVVSATWLTFEVSMDKLASKSVNLWGSIKKTRRTIRPSSWHMMMSSYSGAWDEQRRCAPDSYEDLMDWQHTTSFAMPSMY